MLRFALTLVFAAGNLWFALHSPHVHYRAAHRTADGYVFPQDAFRLHVDDAPAADQRHIDSPKESFRGRRPAPDLAYPSGRGRLEELTAIAKGVTLSLALR